MKKILIDIDEKTDIDELKKVIGFVSDSILDINVIEHGIEVEVNDEANEKEIEEEISLLAKRFISTSCLEEELCKNECGKETYLHEFDSVYYFDEGMLSLQDQSLFLFEYFNSSIENITREMFDNDEIDYINKLYPVLLPISAYKKTGYLKRSPQYAIFCCSAKENMKMLEGIDSMDISEYKSIINSPEYALSPSACFHVYEEYKNRTFERSAVITFTQSVFRNEGRFNFSQYGRMRDYHVREIVFVGDDRFVNESRSRFMDTIWKFFSELNIDCRIVSASDPFVLPKMQKFKKIQKLEKSKYELQISYDKNEYMSVASFNLHGTAFTDPFKISIAGGNSVTGCVGFGLERLVLSFLSQFGDDPENWPAKIRDAYKSKDFGRK